MPEISKNAIAILKSNRGKKLIRIDSLHEDVQWLEFLTYYRPSCYGLFNKDNLHEVHEGPQYDSFFSMMFLNLYNSVQ